MGNLLWRLWVEVWRLDLADRPSQLVAFTLHLLQVNIVAVPRRQRRLGIYEADVSVLHRGLVRHLGSKGDAEKSQQSETLSSRRKNEAHQHVRGSKQVAEWVVQQVDEGGGIQVSVAHHLGGKEGLSGSTAEQTPHHAVAHVHVMGDFLGGKKQT